MSVEKRQIQQKGWASFAPKLCNPPCLLPAVYRASPVIRVTKGPGNTGQMKGQARLSPHPLTDIAKHHLGNDGHEEAGLALLDVLPRTGVWWVARTRGCSATRSELCPLYTMPETQDSVGTVAKGNRSGSTSGCLEERSTLPLTILASGRLG